MFVNVYAFFDVSICDPIVSSVPKPSQPLLPRPLTEFDEFFQSSPSVDNTSERLPFSVQPNTWVVEG